MTPRALSEKDNVSTAAISQWLKPLIEKGVLSWCDEKGDEFSDVADLEKAKRSGKAYLKVAGGCFLPTVFELTCDSRWDKEGEFYAAYDLHLNGDVEDQEFYPDEEIVVDQDIIFDAEDQTSDEKPAVKVLSEKSHSEVLKMVDDFRKSEQAKGSNDAVNINLGKEFSEILSPGRYGMVN